LHQHEENPNGKGLHLGVEEMGGGAARVVWGSCKNFGKEEREGAAAKGNKRELQTKKWERGGRLGLERER
jgi:hypothetical protein